MIKVFILMLFLGPKKVGEFPALFVSKSKCTATSKLMTNLAKESFDRGICMPYELGINYFRPSEETK